MLDFFPKAKSLFAGAKIISEEEKRYKLSNSYVGGVGRIKIVFNSTIVQRFDFMSNLFKHVLHLKFLTHIESDLYV